MINKEETLGLRYLILQSTGLDVDLAIACGRRDEEFQIMPNCEYGEEFFEWYCDQYPDSQFFETPLAAAVEFVKVFVQWEKDINDRLPGLNF